jgi:hypothetical protein
MRRLILALALALALAATVLAPLASARAENANPGVLPVTANAHGKSYGEWSAAWWQWVLSIPTTVNPLPDATGAECAQGQSGHVWFLVGVVNVSGQAERSCTIPSGTALFFPVINTECSTLEAGIFHGNNETELRSCAHAFSFTDLQASIDGVSLTNLASYEIDSPLFTFTLPEDNVLGITAPPFTGMSVGLGVYLLLAPLPVGEHTLHFGGTDSTGFTLDITYHLTVVPAGRRR